MQLTAEQIEANWETHLKIVDRFISSPRKEQFIQMLTELQEVILMAPASGKAHFHNAFPGGYLDHVNRVVKLALKTKQLWEETGLQIDFTDEELVFSALSHDLGKIGDSVNECYLPQRDKWRREKLNEMFTINKDLPFMLIQDRSLFLLQKYLIPLSHNEYMAIRLHDGIYDDANKAYFISAIPESKMRTNIVYILHQADFLASRLEYENWKLEEKEEKSSPEPKFKLKSSDGLMNLVKSL